MIGDVIVVKDKETKKVEFDISSLANGFRFLEAYKLVGDFSLYVKFDTIVTDIIDPYGPDYKRVDSTITIRPAFVPPKYSVIVTYYINTGKPFYHNFKITPPEAPVEPSQGDDLIYIPETVEDPGFKYAGIYINYPDSVGLRYQINIIGGTDLEILSSKTFVRIYQVKK